MRVQRSNGKFKGIELEPKTRFGRWTVVGPESPKLTKANRSRVLCDCGRAGLVRNNRLINGETESCNPCARRLPVVSYGGMHKRLARLLGPARRHKCYACGYDADHWAYQHNDEHGELRSLENRPYSLDPTKYTPMCVTCHKEYDLDYIVNVEGRQLGNVHNH